MLKGSIKLELQMTKQPETSWRIPARVHFIWIGPKLIKDKYVKNINNFCEHNPDYEVILWLERNDSINRQISRVVIKADLLRYEVVFKFGGIYLDT